MLYYNKFLDKLSLKYQERAKAVTHENMFKISPKVLLKSIPRDHKICPILRIQDQFENYQTIPIKKPMRKFAFRFAGCRPKLRQPNLQVDSTRQNKDLLDNFNRKIVVAKRKILKPVTNYINAKEFINYKNIQI